MLKITPIIFLVFFSTAILAQKSYDTRKDAETAIKDHDYKSTIGWILKSNQGITLGKGSMPDRTFAFITELPNLLTYNQYADYNRHKLSHTYNGRGCKNWRLFSSRE